MYSTCIECFIKKVRCEFCNKKLNKSYLRSHVKKQHYNLDDKILNDKKRAASHNDEINSTGGGAARDAAGVLLPTNLNNDDNNNNDECNRTLIVGPSFCGRTHLLLNKLQLIRLCYSEKQIKIITKSPGQYKNLEIPNISVGKSLSDEGIQAYQNC